jgi:divalent metal cation (Fe/Co/Zn/Cd) transporter
MRIGMQQAVGDAVGAGGRAETGADARAMLASRGRRLEYLSVGWNLAEGIVAIAAGTVAGSISLVGFGADSFIEVASALVLVWRLAADHDVARREMRERLALRAIGVAFLALAAYVLVEAARDLAGAAAPEASPAGIALALLSLIAMPLLSRAKRRVADGLGSRAMHADAAQTDFCAWLSGILLGGLVLNAAFGLWWADPVAGLVMVPIIINEGIHALRADPCECH